MAPELITKQEAAKILGVSYPNTINTIINRGELKLKQIGKATRITRRSIYEYLERDDTPQAPKKIRRIHSLQPPECRPLIS